MSPSTSAHTSLLRTISRRISFSFLKPQVRGRLKPHNTIVMKTSYILIGIVIAVVVIGGVLMFQSNNNGQMPSLSEEENMTPPLGEQVQSSPVVTYTDEGYSPKELTVKKGDIVTFANMSSMPMWTASAMHPTHTVYPGTDIKNCGNPGMMDMMFDSHCHIQFQGYNGDREAVIARCMEKDVIMNAVGTQKDTSKKAVQLAEQYEHVYATIGLHPIHLFPPM